MDDVQTTAELPTPEDCEVFIQIWVDTSEISSQGGVKGIYMVDNRLNQGSSREGSADLNTVCPIGQGICWSIMAVDQNAPVSQLEITSIGNCNAWGTNQPKPVKESGSRIFTTRTENSGSYGYSLLLNVNETTFSINAGVSVTRGS